MNARRWLVTLAGLALAAGIVLAHPTDEGPGKGKALPGGFPVVERPADPPISPQLELVGHLPIPAPGGDLWIHKSTVYFGNWGGPLGVKLIDVAEPAKPSLISTLPARPGTSYEDVMVISADTAAFKGDLLAVGLQRQTNGVEFWDVSDPRQPRLLSFFRTNSSAPVHELYLLQREERVLALLACIDSGLRIVDATDPTQPKLLSTWQLQRALKLNPGLGVWHASFDHSVSVSADGRTAYLAYWDAGAVILDISDPAQPRYVGRTLYPMDAEGDTHSAVEADGGRLLITADEDTDPNPAANTIRVTAPATLAGLHPAIELSLTRPLVETGKVRGEVVYVGSGLPNVDYLADPRGKIALIDVKGAPWGTPELRLEWRDQVVRAQEAGATAVLFRPSVFRAVPRDAKVTIPGVSVSKEVATAMTEALAAGEKVEVELAATPGTWGFLRLWDIRDRAKPVEVGRFATPDATRFPPRQSNWLGFTVHNPLVRGNRLYASWYSDGVRVLDIANPAEPKEIGHFIPPFVEGTAIWKNPPGAFGPYPEVWGVVEQNGLLFLSDMQTGLWIVRDLPR